MATTTVATSRFQEGPERRRKAHSKSRKGCGNCKLRRVKCDETRPRCQKCVSYGVSCTYDGKKSPLDLAAQGSFQVDLSRSESESGSGSEQVSFPVILSSQPRGQRVAAQVAQNAYIDPVRVSIKRNMAVMINEALNNEPEVAYGTGNGCGKQSWVFGESDLDVFQRFQERTVMTIGTAKTVPLYRNSFPQLAFSHPFLMHLCLGLTLMHDASLAPTPALKKRYTTASLHHWNTGNALFNQILSRPIAPASRDALWGTAALIGALTFSYIETSDPELSWPIKESETGDLAWLKLSDGKKAIFEIAQPMRADSAFASLREEHERLWVPSWVDEDDLGKLSGELKDLFGIESGGGTSGTGQTDNPYHIPALILSHLKDITPNHDNILNFLLFMNYLTPQFKQLLEVKDPRALMLVGWWFRRLEKGAQWWLAGRARVAAEAIRIWLKRWYGGRGGLSEVFERMGGDRKGEGEIRDEADLDGWFGNGVFMGVGDGCRTQ
ncbi:hypothetical protein BCR34DRAFT_482382 [Clohesyomyces aquaticus]|uniref:Zn(2)-C6 fungal-type domain-containing protein n=1 Tax=Clohesyomyces aquaticus TaxID=1231657 RepID=A0A1Y1ZQU7_9PLEO|nr:hypothetical protein BCR34DRAFT_482382 [Clohesyomyces aquaticus]